MTYLNHSSILDFLNYNHIFLYIQDSNMKHADNIVLHIFLFVKKSIRIVLVIDLGSP